MSVWVFVAMLFALPVFMAMQTIRESMHDDPDVCECEVFDVVYSDCGYAPPVCECPPDCEWCCDDE